MFNLEVFNRKFHNVIVFSVSWGVLPFIYGYFVNTLSLSYGALTASVAIGLLTYVQRTLSLQARTVRRTIVSPVRALNWRTEKRSKCPRLI